MPKHVTKFLKLIKRKIFKKKINIDKKISKHHLKRRVTNKKKYKKDTTKRSAKKKKKKEEEEKIKEKERKKISTFKRCLSSKNEKKRP